MNVRHVYINGLFVPETKAALSIHDTAVATGEVVAEVDRTFNQRLFRLDDHLKRLKLGLQELEIDLPMKLGTLEALTLQTLNLNLPTESAEVDWQTVHYVSRGLVKAFGLFDDSELKPSIAIACFPLTRRLAKLSPQYQKGVDLIVVPQRQIPASILSPQIKSRGRLDYLIARAQAQKLMPGSTGVLLSPDGYIRECTGASLFMVMRDGTLVTAPTETILDGVTRSVVLECTESLGIPVVERNLTVSEALDACEMFVSSTVICLLHARSFNNQLLGDGTVGPITNKIRQAFIQTVGLDYIKQANDYQQLIGADQP